jgi:hypothetical protein
VDPIEQAQRRAARSLAEIQARTDEATLAVIRKAVELLGPVAAAAEQLIDSASKDDRSGCRRASVKLQAVRDRLAGDFSELAEAFYMTRRSIAGQLDAERMRLDRESAQRRR